MSQAPIPSNMEGDRRGSPYAWYRTAFNPRLMASELMMGALPMGVGVADRFTGNRIQNFTDRMSGATLARNQQETNAYMRQLMRNDPGYEQYGIGQRLRNWARNLFGGDDNQGATGPAPIPQMNPSRPYAASSPVFQGNPFGFGSQQFHQFAPSLAPQPLYGTGQGMMRAQPAPLYGTGQGMMRAPTTSGSQGEGGSQGGSSSGGGASSGGGVLSPGGRLLSHGVATRIR
jgi:uncharacterized membrane protein YgcG